MDKKNVQNGKICTTFFKIFAQKVTVLECCREFLKSFRKKLLPELKKRHYGLIFYPKLLKNKMDIYYICPKTSQKRHKKVAKLAKSRKNICL